MNMTPNSNLDRLYELLADQALQGLDAAEARELEALLLEHPDVDASEFDRVAAAFDAAEFAVDADEAMPEALAQRLNATADEWIAGQSADTAPNTGAAPEAEAPAVIARLSWAPWLVAAASLALAAIVWIGSPPAPVPVEQTVAQAFDSFIDAAPADLIRVDWQRVAKDYDIPENGFSGEVVWSGDAQQGFMVFEGLTPNDPSVEQFQLWIIDSTREGSPPVDGGVFDVDSSGRVIIPIRPALGIGAVAAFAVTVEEPGGVVVSTQDRVATLAPVG